MANPPTSPRRARAFYFWPYILKREGPMVPLVSHFAPILELGGTFRSRYNLGHHGMPFTESEFQRSDDRIVIGDVRNTVVGFRKDLETFRLGETAEIDVIDNLAL